MSADMDPIDAELAKIKSAEKKEAVAGRILSKLEGLGDRIDMLRSAGVGVSVVLSVTADEPYETVEIGKSDWRQTLRVPCGMEITDRNTYIEARVIGAAKAFAAALRELPPPEPKEPKPKKGEQA